MKSYKHFTLLERKYLQDLLSEGKSFREIARILERSPSSISREIKRHKPKKEPREPLNRFWYNYWRAYTNYIVARRKGNVRGIKNGSDEWNFVVKGLERHWSPESISGKWSSLYPDKKTICVSTIYRYVKLKIFPNITAKTHLRRKGKRIVSTKSNWGVVIYPDRVIPEWGEEIKQRTRIGDWEGDTVYGGQGKGLIITIVDRRSRMLKAALIKERSSKTVREQICRMLENSPRYTLSLDNGSEFAEFREIERQLDILVYFAEPHKPWQRGTNENTNDILRFYFPKGYNFHELTEERLQEVVLEINMRPRKCLGWLSPFEVFYGVALH